MAQQAKKAPELQDPEVRSELDRRVREDGETVVKGGTGGKSLDAQERLAEGNFAYPVGLRVLRRVRLRCAESVFLSFFSGACARTYVQGVRREG